MVGVRKFDKEEVLDRAARAFWRHGFAATSIQTLEQATGLGRGSLYNAFGDKAALFRAVLARYGATEGAPPLCHLGEADVFTGLSRMLNAIVVRMGEPGRPRGCLVTNTCAGGGGGAPTDTQIAEGVRAMEAAFEAAFLRAREHRQLAADADPRRLARFYCAVVQSLGVMHRALGDPETLHDIVLTALHAWPGRNAPDETAGEFGADIVSR